MTILSSEAIFDMNSSQGMIEPWDPDQKEALEGAAYDLRIDYAYELMGSRNHAPFIGKEKRVTPQTLKLKTVEEDGLDVFMFLPRRPYAVSTVETVSLPNGLVGIIRPRTTTFRCGAILSCSDIAPGFVGKLTFGLIYFGDRPLRIEQESRIASLRFCFLEQPEVHTYRGVWSGNRVSTEGEEERAF
jgi:deoxycytidine triphosphate deaminase